MSKIFKKSSILFILLSMILGLMATGFIKAYNTVCATEEQTTDAAFESDAFFDENGQRFGLGALPEQIDRSALQSMQKDASAADLPVSVDLSQDIYFPVIGDQGQLGSCNAWATTYYTYTYEVARLNNLNVKNSSTTNNLDRVYSPKWTYNYINDGEDDGSYVSDAFRLLTYAGAATWNEFPYSGTATALNYREWCTNTNTMRNALRTRVSNWHWVKAGLYGNQTPIKSYNDPNLSEMKSLLSNGHPIVCSTDFGSPSLNWRTQNVSGKTVVTHSQDRYPDIRHGHGLTIVGYDDTIAYDLNGNGIIEDFERGAFKIANSWGTTYGDSGFIWVMYDAMNTVSNASNLNVANRLAVFEDNLCSMEVKNYSLDLTCEVTLNGRYRNDISVSIEKQNSSNNFYRYSYALFDLDNILGFGPYTFNGNTTINDVTFVFDFGVLNASETSLNSWRVKIQNLGQYANVTTVKSVQFKDSAGTVLQSYSPNQTLNNATEYYNLTRSAYTITASAGTNGSISPSGSVSVNYGGSLTFIFTPNTGYEKNQVLIAG
ncbi:MAG: hypothetical protein FWG51_05525, partial [Firmicutes bacterium]|nr:hypothetical protein [Bacillota bacterium]